MESGGKVAKPAAAASGKAKKPKRATDDAVKPVQHGKRHEHTASEPTGAGERAAAEPVDESSYSQLLENLVDLESFSEGVILHQCGRRFERGGK